MNFGEAVNKIVAALVINLSRTTQKFPFTGFWNVRSTLLAEYSTWRSQLDRPELHETPAP
jgi:hypothetical protein